VKFTQLQQQQLLKQLPLLHQQPQPQLKKQNVKVIGNAANVPVTDLTKDVTNALMENAQIKL